MIKYFQQYKTLLRILGAVFFTAFISESCSVKEDVFGYNEASELKKLEVVGQLEPTKIDKKTCSVEVFLSDSADYSHAEIKVLSTPALSSTDKVVGDAFDFIPNKGVDTLWVYAEDHHTTAWKIHTDLSKTAAIKDITFENQSGKPIVKEMELQLLFNPNTDVSNIKLKSIDMPKNCEASIEVGQSVNLSKELTITVTNTVTKVSKEYTLQGVSDLSKLVQVKAEGAIADTKILSNARIIELLMPENANLGAVKLSEVILADSFKEEGSHNLKKGAVLNLSKPVSFTMSENGDKHIWTIRAIKALQLPNKEFSQWFDDHAEYNFMYKYDYKEPGQSVDNIYWSTTNRGAVMANTKTIPTVFPLDSKGATLKTSVIDKRFAFVYKIFQISTGMLYTGAFERNDSKIIAAAKEGDVAKLATLYRDFDSRPKGVKIKYRYTSGEEYYEGVDDDKNGIRGVDFSDKGEIGIALEDWDEGGSHKRVATYWFQPKGTDFTWKSIEEDLTYGKFELNQEYVYDNSPYLPSDGFVDEPEKIIPNKILVIFRSSAEADVFKGAQDSQLDIESIELTY